MLLTNAQYTYYVNERLKLPPGQRAQYLEQVDSLIDRLANVVREQPDLGITKFLKTGSLRKGTVIKPIAGNAVDADIAVYINEASTTPEVLDDLHTKLRRLAQRAYPTKSAEDFRVQPRTLGIHFVDSGLDVDLVPIIPIAGPGNYGYQPSSRGDAMVLTSIPGQLDFIRKYKDAYYNWTSLVRLMKRWRDHHELSQLGSFAIELIVCYLQHRDGLPGSLAEGLSRAWMFIAQELPYSVFSFDETGGGRGAGSVGEAPITLIDPVNENNNVTRRITPNERSVLVAAAEQAWEIYWASRDVATKAETLDYLKILFGRNLVIEESA